MTTIDSDATVPKPRDSLEASVAGAASTMRAIYQRRAVRTYDDRPVSRQDIQLVLDAAIHAPSAVNCQPWVFVVIQEREVVARYAKEGRQLLLNEPPAVEVVESGLANMDQLRQMASGPDFELFHGAPALVVIYATSADEVPDCFLAAQNLMLAAWTLGLGTCPIGLARPLFNRAEVKEELGVSPEWPCALPIAVGWPDGETPPTSRRPAQIIAWK
jgi:nitroreductase